MKVTRASLTVGGEKYRGPQKARQLTAADLFDPEELQAFRDANGDINLALVKLKAVGYPSDDGVKWRLTQMQNTLTGE